MISLGLDWSADMGDDAEAVAEGEEIETNLEEGSKVEKEGLAMKGNQGVADEANPADETRATPKTGPRLSLTLRPMARMAWRGRRTHTSPNALQTPSIAQRHRLVGDVERANAEPDSKATGVSVPASLALEPRSEEMLAIVGAHRTIHAIANGYTRVRLNGACDVLNDW